jgi:hypothetical protein
MAITQERVRVDLRKAIEKVACRAFLNANQENILSLTDVKVNLNTLTYDLGNNFDESTNYRFTAPVAGLYKIIGSVWYLNTSVQADKRYKAMIYKNGSAIAHSSAHSSHVDYISANVSDEVFLKKDDYIELWAYTTGTGDTVDIYGEANGFFTYLIVRLISKEGIRQ